MSPVVPTVTAATPKISSIFSAARRVARLASNRQGKPFSVLKIRQKRLRLKRKKLVEWINENVPQKLIGFSPHFSGQDGVITGPDAKA
jgi:hypothetical protein